MPKGVECGSRFYRLRHPLYGLSSAPVRFYEFMAALLMQYGHMFFPLDNQSSSTSRAQGLRDALESTFRKEKYITSQISSRWIRVLSELERLEPYATKISQVYSLCKDHGVPEEEWEQMLEFFHRLRVILYLTNNETLSERVITDPKWLISNLAKVIRDPALHANNEEEKAKDHFPKF